MIGGDEKRKAIGNVYLNSFSRMFDVLLNFFSTVGTCMKLLVVSFRLLWF